MSSKPKLRARRKRRKPQPTPLQLARMTTAIAIEELLASGRDPEDIAEYIKFHKRNLRHKAILKWRPLWEALHPARGGQGE